MTRRYAAETLGTFALVFTGTGAVIVDAISEGTITHLGVAVTFGLVVMSMVYAFGDVSGAHINPAVTIGFWAARRFPGRQVAPYIASQFAGAILASALLRGLFPESKTLGETLPRAGDTLQSFPLEVVITFFLMLVILCVATGAREKGVMAGAAIGAVVAFQALFAGPISGASMNPARSLGPALVGGTTEHLWIYLTAPVGGALLAVACWQLLRADARIAEPEVEGAAAAAQVRAAGDSTAEPSSAPLGSSKVEG